jgi:hypothetical protein
MRLFVTIVSLFLSIEKGSWALLVKRVLHSRRLLRSGDDVRLSPLALGSPIPQLATWRGDARPCTPVPAVVLHVTWQQLAAPVPPLVPAGVARAAAHVVGPGGGGGSRPRPGTG